MKVLLACLLSVFPLAAADWPGFRGPNADGKAEGAELPMDWGASENLVWRTALPGPGSSSPVVSGGRIFLTCYSGYGLDVREPGDINRLRRHALCLEAATGRILWQHEIESPVPDKPYTGQYITTHGYASGSAVTDGRGVFFFFAHAGVHAFTLDGRKVWERSVGGKAHDWGAGASPVLHGDWVFINAALESDTLYALDRRTGREVWQVKGFPASWNTPLLIRAGGREELVVNASGRLRALDPASGRELWFSQAIRAAELCPSVVADGDRLFVIGSPKGEAMAVRAGGSGDVTASHVLWRTPRGSNVSSPIYHEGHLYFVNDSRGTFHCLKADSGEEVYEGRLPYGRDRWYASPVLHDGRLFYLSRSGRVAVLAARPELEVLASTVIADDGSVFNASPAVVEGRVYLRSDRYAYCIGAR
jgi:outer membrane protein assembly factor BamB